MPASSIFNDKGSLILRKMLRDPGRSWVVRDFVRELGLGQGWVSVVLSELRRKGYLRGAARGRKASSSLQNKDELIQEWTRHYTFEQNRSFSYYFSEKTVLPNIRSFFKQAKFMGSYAFTLHTGANLITQYVRQENVYLYLDPIHFEEISLELRKFLDLKELKQGGNIHFIYPYYKNSVFFGVQKINGYRVVSNLQLYLDLYHFLQRGREHAEYLQSILKEKSRHLGQ